MKSIIRNNNLCFQSLEASASSLVVHLFRGFVHFGIIPRIMGIKRWVFSLVSLFDGFSCPPLPLPRNNIL